MYVYCSYNESQNSYLNFWNLLFKSKKWYFDSKLLFSNPKLIFQFIKLLTNYQNGHFNFEYFYLNTKFYISILKFLHLNLKFWFEPEISILNYSFGLLEPILQVWKLLIESKNGNFHFESRYLNLKNQHFNSDFFFKIQKTYLI
jgi:hypothetical protein